MAETPGTALARREAQAPTRGVMTHDEINRSWRLAEALAASGVFPKPEQGEMTPGLAFAIMLIGHDLGLTPTQALMGVYLVKGRPQVGYTLLGSFVKRIPGYDYKVAKGHPTETECSIDFLIDGELVGNSTYTIEDAKKQGIVKDKGGWKTVPRNMCLARSLSNGVRWFMPDATGGISVYVEGEIQSRPGSALTDGAGSGEASGIDLGPKAEKVLARAAELGHEVLADRGTAEMVLGSRSPEVAVEWCKKAEAELDAYEAEHPVADAEVVGDEDPVKRARELREIALQLVKDAEQCEADGEPEKAEELRVGARELREQAVVLEPDFTEEAS